MKAKRFQTTMIKSHSKSNTTVKVSFDTLDEARAHVENERKLHPRSKKFNNVVIDAITKERIKL